VLRRGTRRRACRGPTTESVQRVQRNRVLGVHGGSSCTGPQYDTQAAQPKRRLWSHAAPGRLAPLSTVRPVCHNAGQV
jgi:hypothetical protein